MSQRHKFEGIIRKVPNYKERSKMVSKLTILVLCRNGQGHTHAIFCGDLKMNTIVL